MKIILFYCSVTAANNERLVTCFFNALIKSRSRASLAWSINEGNKTWQKLTLVCVDDYVGAHKSKHIHVDTKLIYGGDVFGIEVWRSTILIGAVTLASNDVRRSFPKLNLNRILVLPMASKHTCERIMVSVRQRATKG